MHDVRSLPDEASAPLSLPMAALAAATAGTTTTLAAVVVTGQLQTHEPQDTTSSIAVYTGNDVEAGTEVDLYDIVERTPNAQGSFGEIGFAIRGNDQRGVGGRQAHCR